ncbi:hypothetical protein [Methylomonas sp. AM2-LC]|uniref:hypothetical protein n=1 Tax=Methylomonas sp. AM2-LC TaxID=3153301 RepID=UPI003265CDA2
MKYTVIGLFVLSIGLSLPVCATEYIYRDLMANSLPAVRCEALNTAKQTATQPFTIDKYSKKFCQSQGYGWHVDKVKDLGKTVCNTCTDNNTLNNCHQEDVVVSCKRIKPGSVGMLPGKG